MRVTVVEPIGVGGLAHFAYQLCDGLAACGADVTLVTSDDYELGSLPHRFALEPRMRLWSTVDSGRGAEKTSWQHRIAQVRHKLRRIGRGFILLREWTRLVLYLRRTRPDIVQFGMIHFPFQAVFLAWLRLSGLTLTQICHEFEPREQLHPWMRRLHRAASHWLYTQFSTVFFLSERVQKEFEGYFGARFGSHVTIPHGNEDIFKLLRDPDADEFERMPTPGPVVLFFGGIRPSKGVPDLIEALALVPRDRTFHALVVGYPSKQMDIPALRCRITALGLDRRVTLDPRYVGVGEVAGLMERAALVVLPYRSATQSGIAHLAFSFGRPVVATSVGGLSEVVEHEGTGLLVPPEDPQAMAAAIDRLITDGELRVRLGERAAHLSKTRYGWTRVAGLVLDQYRSIEEGGLEHVRVG